MTPVIVSIQHTGARFLSERFGLEWNDIIHTNQPLVDVIDKIDGRDIITPLRHPEDVWRSWCKRYIHLDTTTRLSRLMSSVFTLGNLSMHHNIDFIAVDKQEDSRISDWSKVCHNPKDVEYPEVDLSYFWEMSFIREHYDAN